MLEYRYGFSVGQFRLSQTSHMLKNIGKEAKIGHWPAIVHAILIEGETRADLKCEEKEPSVINKLIIAVIGVFKMSI